MPAAGGGDAERVGRLLGPPRPLPAGEKDSAAIAPRERRVDADYSKPAEVLAVIHEMLGGRYMWGSDNPFMSWCDDDMSDGLHVQAGGRRVLHALPRRVRDDMPSVAPRGVAVRRHGRRSKR